jgi:hypothetical protein
MKRYEELLTAMELLTGNWKLVDVLVGGFNLPL